MTRMWHRLLASCVDFSWPAFVRRRLFQADPEVVHETTMERFASAMEKPSLRRILEGVCGTIPDPRLRTSCFGLDFRTPIGLAAGFDKSARWFPALESLGFGSVEVGTLTPKPQAGNDKPRLFRLEKDRALINRMGFNNDGIEAAAERLRNATPKPTGFVLGINLGKNKVTPNETAVDDYLAGLERLYEFGDYFAINVSSPNTEGLRDLQSPDSLFRLLEQITQKNRELTGNRKPKPVLVKIAPDLEPGMPKEIAALALQTGVAGIIATNTTVSRANLRTECGDIHRIGNGGLSGQPLTVRSRDVVRELFEHAEGKIPIVGVGGVMRAADAWEMLRAGASLVQVYTGFVYGGPRFVGRLHEGLLHKMDRAGVDSMTEVATRFAS